MEPAFVLVHSLLLGPSTWAPVAGRLASSGTATVVPSLVGVTDADDPPFWPHVVDRVGAAVSQLPQGVPVLVVAHSNAAGTDDHSASRHLRVLIDREPIATERNGQRDGSAPGNADDSAWMRPEN